METRRLLSPLERESPYKRQKSSQEENEKNLCMIFLSMSVADDLGESIEELSYEVFISDLRPSHHHHLKSEEEEEEFIPIAPAYRLEFGDLPKSFCVLGSKLFVFECTGFGEEPRKYVHTLDLESYKKGSSTTLVKRSELGRIHDINHAKKFPIATPTPDGKKILFFSSRIQFEPYSNPITAGDQDFEMYDPATGYWTTLPGIQHDWMGFFLSHFRLGLVETSGFTFIGTSTFFVQVRGYDKYSVVEDCGLTFSIDLDFIGSGWQQMHTFLGAPVDNVFPRDCGRFFVLDDRLCVTPVGAYDVLRSRKFPEWVVFFPQPCEETYVGCVSDVTLVIDNDVGKFFLCNLNSLTNNESAGHPHLEIHTLSCDVAKFRESGSAELSTSIPRSLRFRVDEPRESFAKVGFFSF